MKHIKFNMITFFIILTLLFTACSSTESFIPSCCVFSIPKPQITGQKTVVERQIIGDYKELEKDAWIVSSVKTNVQKGEGASSVSMGDEKLFRAMKIREFHEEKIRNYKNESAIGERNNGLIIYRRHSKYEHDKKLKDILAIVIKEENKARRTIFKRNLIRSGIEKPGDNKIEAFGRMFAEEQRALARKNDWIEINSGMWVRKR
ncbi:MAG: YdbL family protein [bacterium]|nr:YdbL family protein [bacterium]